MTLERTIRDLCESQSAMAKQLMKDAGSDSTPIAECVSRLACTVLETVDLVTRHGDQPSRDSTLNMVMSYGASLNVASAALMTTRILEARLRVVESQLKRRSDLEDRLRIVEAQLTTRLADADLH